MWLPPLLAYTPASITDWPLERKHHRVQNLNLNKLLCVIFCQQGNMLTLYQSKVSSWNTFLILLGLGLSLRKCKVVHCGSIYKISYWSLFICTLSKWRNYEMTQHPCIWKQEKAIENTSTYTNRNKISNNAFITFQAPDNLQVWEDGVGS